MKFAFTTTHMSEFKPFKVENKFGRNKKRELHHSLVRTNSYSGQYKTTNQRDLIPHQYKVPLLDTIVYP
jgi:hypothetical protein